MREFEYVAASSVAEAVRLLRETEGAIPLAGGTDVVVSAHHGKIKPTLVVDLKRIPGLSDMVESPDAVEIGCMVSMTAVTRSPLVREWLPALAQAAASVGCWQVRNLATLGGNLCNASPSADTAVPLVLYGTTVQVSDGTSTRDVPLPEFLTGPGTTALRPGELLVGLRVFKPSDGLRSAYTRRSIRRSMDIPLVNIGAALRISDGVVTEARIALGAVDPVPFRAADAEAALAGRPAGAEAFAEAARLAAAAARPITDVRATAEYRRAMVEVFVRRALVQAEEVAA